MKLSAALLCVGALAVQSVTGQPAPRSDSIVDGLRSSTNQAAPALKKEADVERRGPYTTEAYNREALRLVLAEANAVAAQLGLEESLPITERDLTFKHISPYSFTLMWPHGIGAVHTKRYSYGAAKERKLCYVESLNQDKQCFDYKDRLRIPRSQMNTNAAFQLAREWLVRFGADVDRLDRECQLRVELEQLINSPRSKTITPVYYVSWVPKEGKERTSLASVRLFLPDRKLMALRMEDQKYNLRAELRFTNLSSLVSLPE